MFHGSYSEFRVSESFLAAMRVPKSFFQSKLIPREQGNLVSQMWHAHPWWCHGCDVCDWQTVVPYCFHTIWYRAAMHANIIGRSKRDYWRPRDDATHRKVFTCGHPHGSVYLWVYGSQSILSIIPHVQLRWKGLGRAYVNACMLRAVPDQTTSEV